MTPYERALKYIETCDPAVSEQGGHSTTYRVAMTIVHGFALAESEALAAMGEYNKKCQPPWTEKDLRHKITQAIKTQPKKERGWMLGNGTHTLNQNAYYPKHAEPPVPAPVSYDPVILAKLAEQGKEVLRPRWLSDISPIDPGTCDANDFLKALYYPEHGEKILCFSSTFSQGDCLWPDEADKLPLNGRLGAWYLNQPVSGKWVELPNGKKSRRVESCITSWRYLLIESDEAPAETWLAALATLPLPIAALYTSGKRSIHTLIRVDAQDKATFEQIRTKLRPTILMLGGDKQAFKGPQLTRLPYHWRHEDLKKIDGKSVKITHEKPLFQRLLYLNPSPGSRPLIHAPILRDTVQYWSQKAVLWARSYKSGTGYIEDGIKILRAMRYHQMKIHADDFCIMIPQLLTHGN